MCPNCDNNGDAAAVVDTVINNLAGVPYGMMYATYTLINSNWVVNSWFDVEQCDGCWFDAGTNAQYLATAVNEAVSRGATIGIYSRYTIALQDAF